MRRRDVYLYLMVSTPSVGFPGYPEDISCSLAPTCHHDVLHLSSDSIAVCLCRLHSWFQLPRRCCRIQGRWALLLAYGDANLLRHPRNLGIGLYSTAGYGFPNGSLRGSTSPSSVATSRNFRNVSRAARPGGWRCQNTLPASYHRTGTSANMLKLILLILSILVL